MTAVELPGSRAAACRSPIAGVPDPESTHEVVFHLRPRPNSGGLGWVNREALLPPGQRRVLTWSQYAAGYAAAPEDVAIVRAFVAANRLSVIDEDPELRRVAVTGTCESLEQAFAVRLRLHGHDGGQHLAHDRALTVPPSVRTVSHSVLGLNGCTQLRWSSSRLYQDGGSPSAREVVSPGRVLLGVPEGLEGRGIDVAVVDLGADAEPDLELQALTDAIADMAPGARIKVHRGSAAVRDIVDAILLALRGDPPPTVVVLGWGAPEQEWSGAAIRTLQHIFLSAASLGTAIVAACPGDGQPWFPASSPHVVACSALDRRHANSQPAISTVFPAPSWQEMLSSRGSVAGRVMPDVAAPAGARPGDSFPSGPPDVVAAARVAGVVAAVAEAIQLPPGLLTPALALSTSRRMDVGAGVQDPLLFASLMSAVTEPVVPGVGLAGPPADQGSSPLIATRELS